MMKKIAKNGFTLAEILFVLILIGILASLGTQTITYQTNNYKHLYIAAYNNIGDGIGNLIAKNVEKKASYNKDSEGHTTTFCKLLAAEYHTISNGGDCSSVYNIVPVGGFTDGSVSLDSPSFTLTNGQRFYITNTFTPVGVSNYFNEPATVIIVDINGTSDPNLFDTVSYTGSRKAEVVAFAVTESGKIFPLSPLGDDDAHFLVNVQQCSTTAGCSQDLSKNIIKKLVPLREGLCIANRFPPKGAASALTVQYNTDSSFNFKKAYSVDANCNSATNYCRVIPADIDADPALML